MEVDPPLRDGSMDNNLTMKKPRRDSPSNNSTSTNMDEDTAQAVSDENFTSTPNLLDFPQVPPKQEKEYDIDDDVALEEDDPNYQTITLKAAQKELWKPWKDTLIVQLFDKGPGYMTLKRCLTLKWNLSAPFSVINIGNETCVTRFANRVWIHIPWVHIEYFDQCLLHMIDNRVGKVLAVD
ncbi:hypothetical protein V2J09_000022 [Rumex salicifolius]